MGNQASSVKEQDPTRASQGAWVSQKTRELDSNFGLGREPVPLGKSFTFIGLNGVNKTKLKVAAEDNFKLHTEKRAGTKEAEYSNARTSRTNRKDVQALLNAPVAKWRTRMYAARRRVYLQVSCALALSRKDLHKAYPVENLAFCIPICLREHRKEFLEAQKTFIKLAYKADVFRDVYESIAANATSSGQGSPLGTRTSISTPLGARGSMTPGGAPLGTRTSALPGAGGLTSRSSSQPGATVMPLHPRSSVPVGVVSNILTQSRGSERSSAAGRMASPCNATGATGGPGASANGAAACSVSPPRSRRTSASPHKPHKSRSASGPHASLPSASPRRGSCAL
eukprot:gene23962-9534_t